MLEMSNISITINHPYAILQLLTNLRRKTEPFSKSLSSNETNSDVFLTLFHIQFSNTLLNIMLLNAYTAMLIFMLKCIFLGSLLELSFSFSSSSHSYTTKPLPHDLMIF
jgi:hypothetical protein